MNIGIIGCGNISTAYLQLAGQFKGVSIIACSDINESAAQAQAEQFGCRALSVEALLAATDIDLIINLTVPRVHAQISTQILKAGKHVYSEKPFVLSLEEGQELQALARKQGRRIGSAPDTFLGGAHQQARHLLDSGQLGTLIGGSCHFMNHGMEDWHPNPDFFYQAGGGPMLDMGPYYISNLVQMIGPVKRLMAMSSTPSSTRTITSEPRAGETINVETPTSIHALLEFHSGALITVAMSWDVTQHEHNLMELYGSSATLHVPDPNFFGGELRIATRQENRLVALDHPLVRPNHELQDGRIMPNYRGIGLADMVAAIEQGREHRCNDSFALHVVDVMSAALLSGETGQSITLQSTCDRPAALDAVAARALLN